MGPRITYVKSAKSPRDNNDPLIVTSVVSSASDEITASDLKKAAYSFLASGEYLKMDIYYDGQPTGSKIVASHFLEKADGYPPDSWFVSIAIYDPTIRQMVLKGEINSFSFDPEGASWISISQIEVLKNDKDGSISRGKVEDKMTTEQSCAKIVADCARILETVKAEKQNQIDTQKGTQTMTTDQQIAQLGEVVKALETLLNVVLDKLGELSVATGAQSVVKSAGNARQDKLKSSGAIAAWH
jgi:hypothetical protein